jgi:hypothetical protein
MSEVISYQTIYTTQIFLNSGHANAYYNSTQKSLLSFNLKDIISLEKNCLEVRLSLVNAQFPYSFYQINANNNKFYLYYNGITQTIYFPYGNYNVNTFIAQWNITVSTTLNLTYSTVTNKVLFTSSLGLAFHFYDDTNSLFPVLGFVKGTYYVSTSASFYAPYCFNFNGLPRLNVTSTNLSIRNVDSYNIGQCSIISSVPINCYPGGVILYNNYTNTKNIINIGEMQTFGIEIRDDYENLIDFNNQDWTMTFQIDTVKEVIINKKRFEDYYDEPEMEL